MSAEMALLAVLMGAALLSIGSFTNVIIARLPRALATPNDLGETWATNSWRYVLSGTSRCGSCDAAVRPGDNVPVLSYLWLGGKCRSCQSRIPVYHPFVEAAMPLAGLGLLLVFGLTADVAPLLVALPATVAIAVIDFRTFMVPTVLVWPAFGMVLLTSALVCAVTDRWELSRAGALGAALFVAPMFLLWLLMPGGMGFGDVRLSVLLGWLVGWALSRGPFTSLAMSLSIVLLVACLVSIGTALAKGSVSKGSKIAFGPGLVVASWLVIVAVGPLKEGLLV